MAKQTFTTGQVLTASQMTSLQQTALLGGAASAKVASYTLVAADAGTAITMSNAGATTITVNTGLFADGDIITIVNIGAGACTITAGTATVTTSGSLVLAQNQGGVLRFTSASAAIFFQFAVPSTSSFVGVSLVKSAAQSINNATDTAITWNTEDYDTDGFHSTVSNTDRITIPTGKGGYYLVSAKLSFAANATGVRSCTIKKNGTTNIIGADLNNQGGSASAVLNFERVISCVATDYFTLQAYQTSGGALNTDNAAGYTYFTMTYLGA
jgi:hypothetical protein